MESSIDQLKALIAEGDRFSFGTASYVRRKPHGTYSGPDTPEWTAWKRRSLNLVNKLTEENSAASCLVTEAMAVRTEGNDPEDFERAKSTFIKALQLALQAMEVDSFGELRGPKTTSGSPALSNRVFIVHGHDHALKAELERFLKEIGLAPIILHRQPDKGQTIIEKLEEHGDVGYAFVLLTPDDVASAKAQEHLPDSTREKEKRARQNVIFEFGYFTGKLGRDRVCCIYKEGVVLPSDLDGLMYKKVTDSVESQAYAIVKELRAAGYKVAF